MQFYNKETGETASNSEIWKLFEESGLDAGVSAGKHLGRLKISNNLTANAVLS